MVCLLGSSTLKHAYQFEEGKMGCCFKNSSRKWYNIKNILIFAFGFINILKINTF
jgi:hypothetical protein